MKDKTDQTQNRMETGIATSGRNAERTSEIDWSGDEQQTVDRFFDSRAAVWPAQPIHRRMQSSRPQLKIGLRQGASDRANPGSPT